MRLALLLVLVVIVLAALTLGVFALVQDQPTAGPPVSPATERIDTPIVPGEDERIDDFEVRAQSLEAWHAVVREERTRADFLIAEGGATPESRFHLTADLVRPADPDPADIAGIIARVAGVEARDVSRYRGVELWLAATPGLYIVQLGSSRVADHDHFNAYVEVTEAGWHRHRIPFDDFEQEGFGDAVAWAPHDITHIALYSVNDGSVTLAIDDLRFFED